VVSESQEFAHKIGVIAASWSQAEVNLHCLFAVLLGTTPEEAATRLKDCRTAAGVTRGAREIAAASLTGIELDSLSAILDQLDEVRLLRNRVQHDVWAWKASDTHRIFTIHSNEYLAFVANLWALDESGDGNEINCAIEAAMTFAARASNGYTLEDLEDIATAINSVSKLLLQSMFHQIRLRRA
jgi:hypothetical protein